jgi:hypothetical protein
MDAKLHKAITPSLNSGPASINSPCDVPAAVEKEITAETKLLERELKEASKVFRRMEKDYPKSVASLLPGHSSER